jgi:hypothetical protein
MQVPDVMGRLPVIRQFCIDYPVDTTGPADWYKAPHPRDDRELHISSTIISGHRWIDGEDGTATCDPMGRWLVMRELAQGHEAPADDCSCGFYGWYPWAETRWPALTPLTDGWYPNVDPRPHPLVHDSVTGLIRDGLTKERRHNYIPGVMEVSGSVVLAHAGVRAGRGRLKALIDPTTMPLPPQALWHELLGHNWGSASAKRDVSAMLAESLHDAKRAWPGAWMTWGEAVRYSEAAWSPALRAELPDYIV